MDSINERILLNGILEQERLRAFVNAVKVNEEFTKGKITDIMMVIMTLIL